MFYRYFPFWKFFFEALGWEVLVSKEKKRKEKIVYFEDSCLPMKLLVTHAMDLVDRTDHLFAPRLVSLQQKYILCPKFRAVPDILRLALKQGTSLLDETIDLRTGKDAHVRSFWRLGNRLGSSREESERAFLKAHQSFMAFQKDWSARINGLPMRQLFELGVPAPHEKSPAGLRVGLVGHPYNLFDVDINKDTPALMKHLGMEIITSDLLPEEVLDREVSALSKEIYWSSGREIVGALFHFLSGGMDGVIFLTSFKCGIDALLQEFVKRSLRIRGGCATPLLVLSFDEHTGREGLSTRLEAFRDVMEERRTVPNPKRRVINKLQ